MHQILLLGAGKIGQMIAHFLAEGGDYRLRVGDMDPVALSRLRQTADVETVSLDAAEPSQLASALRGCGSVISAMCFRRNRRVAEAALETGASYFDLTEDVETALQIRRLAATAGPGQIFMPQCGLAPGFISILAQHYGSSAETVTEWLKAYWGISQ